MFGHSMQISHWPWLTGNRDKQWSYAHLPCPCTLLIGPRPWRAASGCPLSCNPAAVTSKETSLLCFSYSPTEHLGPHPLPTLKAHPILQACEAVLKQWWQMIMMWALLGMTGSEGRWAGCPSPCGLASSPCALSVVCKHHEQVVLPHKLLASRTPGSTSLRRTQKPSGTAGHTSRSAWRQVPAGTGCRTGSGGSPAHSVAPWLSVDGKRWHTEPSNMYTCWQGVSIYALCCGATQISAVQVVVRLLFSSIIIGSYK